jgi:hypothetical protein
MSRVDALLREREGYLARGLADRVALVDVELARFGVAVDAAPEVEAATIATPETAARRPGRPRKGA